MELSSPLDRVERAFDIIELAGLGVGAWIVKEVVPVAMFWCSQDDRVFRELVDAGRSSIRMMVDG